MAPPVGRAVRTYWSHITEALHLSNSEWPPPPLLPPSPAHPWHPPWGLHLKISSRNISRSQGHLGEETPASVSGYKGLAWSPLQSQLLQSPRGQCLGKPLAGLWFSIMSQNLCADRLLKTSALENGRWGKKKTHTRQRVSSDVIPESGKEQRFLWPSKIEIFFH